MGINTRVHERRFALLYQDMASGKVQELIDAGMTRMQIANKYNVAENTISRYARIGKLQFKSVERKAKKAEEIAASEVMTETKKFALYGRW